jgi:rare lipoprotein A
MVFRAGLSMQPRHSHLSIWLVGALLLFGLLAPAGPRAEDDEPDRTSVGLASFYARSLHGRRTASGERLDRQALTAAHRSYPFGTRVRVVNLVNGKSVVVRINDRGPHVTSRIIDLTEAAAKAIGLWRKGVVGVRLEPLLPEE